MIGAFIQVNLDSKKWRGEPVGYIICENGCWEWVGQIADGYGRIAGKNTRLAHKWMWEEKYGPVPPGLQLDHKCRNRSCVNPDHLEPVTSQVNILRGEGVAAHRSQQTHCKRGHLLSGDNLNQNSLRKKRIRSCQTCARDRARTYYYTKVRKVAVPCPT